jgi:hypothetical protein
MAFLGGILSIIHPELYQLGREAIVQLAETQESITGHEDLPAILREWASPFSAMSVISNRESPCHRDMSGRNPWYDMLVTTGNYSHGRLELPGIGVRLSYDPRTVVALASRLLVHGAAEIKGDRACFALYMRNNVHERLGIRAGNWMNLNEARM